LAEYQKTPEYQAREQERLAILNWIKTGENPPPSMMDKTEDERLSMYKDTHAYQSQQASLAAWQAEQEKKAEEGQKQSDTWAAFREQEKKGGYADSVGYIEDLYLKEIDKLFDPFTAIPVLEIFGFRFPINS
jgi:hypothetical protein